MTVTNVNTNKETLTLVVDTEYDAPVTSVWRLWADPRLLEQWWGPPEYPATVTEHDFRPGGQVRYHMTGPEGEVHGGWWEFKTIEDQRLIEFDDGFLDSDGNRNASLPTVTIRVSIGEDHGKTMVTTTSWFPSLEAMEQLIEMGMEEGMLAALSQVDGLLASLVS